MQKELSDSNLFLYIDTLPEQQRQTLQDRLLKGSVVIEPIHTRENGKDMEVPGGLVHHWLAIGYIPGDTRDQAMALAQDYARHPQLYAPDVQRAQVRSNTGEHYSIYFRFYRKAIVTAVYDTEFTAPIRFPCRTRTALPVFSILYELFAHFCSPPLLFSTRSKLFVQTCAILSHLLPASSELFANPVDLPHPHSSSSRAANQPAPERLTQNRATASQNYSRRNRYVISGHLRPDVNLAVPSSDIHRVIDAVWRIESAKLIGALTRIVRDVGLAEDLAQDALIAALDRWPQSGVPDNPGAWLMATAKHRAIDHFRRNKLLDRKHEEIGRELKSQQESAVANFDIPNDDQIGDDLLRLVFISCHHVLSTEARVALTLRLLGGLTTQEIARAYLVPEPTIAQRIVRAKRTLSEAHVPFEVPAGPELQARLSSVLEVIYLIFNEGYSATAGEDWMRPALCEDALRLGRILAELVPNEPEVQGLVALMEIQASRSKSRVDQSGEPVLLLDQNRAQWDQLLIRRGLAALDRAEKLGGANGIYALQAALAACHARARTADETDWPRIVSLYQTLGEISPSPIVELNRAVALGMAVGPQAGLDLADTLTSEPSLKSYHLLPSVRADLLKKLGRLEEARTEFERAAALTRNARERNLLLERSRNCAS